jgi:hypothetical protein
MSTTSRVHVRGEAFNSRRLPDCRLRCPRTGELPGPRSYSGPLARSDHLDNLAAVSETHRAGGVSPLKSTSCDHLFS